MKRTLLISAGLTGVALGAVALAVPYAADSYARVSVENIFKRARDGGAKVAKYDSIQTNIWEGEVILHGVELESAGDSPSTLRMDTFRTHFPLELNGTVSAGLVQAVNLRISSGDMTYSFPEARIEDFVFRSKGKSESPFLIKAFLKRIDASEISAPEWKTTHVTEGDRIIKGLEITDLDHGKAGAMRFESLSGAVKTPKGDNVTATTGAGIYKDLDVAALAAIYAESSKDEQPMEKLVGHISVADFQIKGLNGDDSLLVMDTMVMDNLHGRLMPEPFSTMMALSSRIAQEEDTTKISLDDIKLYNTLTSSMLTGFSFDKMATEGLKITSPAEKLDLSIGSITLEKFNNGIIGNFSIEKTALTSDALKSFSLASFSFDALDIKPSLAFLSTVTEAAGSQSNEAVEVLASRPFASIPTFSRVTIQGLETRNDDMNLAVEELSISTANHVQGLPLTAGLALKGLAVDKENTEHDVLGARAFLKELGYDDLTLDYSVGYTWNESAKTLSFVDTGLTMRNAGHIGLAGGVATLEKNALTGALDDLFPALLEAPVQPIQITYKDSGLANKLIAYYSNLANISEADMRVELKKQVSDINMAFGGAVDAASIAAIHGFLDKPDTLSLVLEPREELTPLDIYAAYSMQPEMLATQFKASIRQ